MLLLEQVEALKTGFPIQLFASDLDEEALAYGREGRYPETIVADVSEACLQRFFVREGAYYQVKKELREIILFAPHNLLKDPPFSRRWATWPASSGRPRQPPAQLAPGYTITPDA